MIIGYKIIYSFYIFFFNSVTVLGLIEIITHQFLYNTLYGINNNTVYTVSFIVYFTFDFVISYSYF